MRVATAGTWALAQDYGASPATAGLVLTSFGPDQPPDWAAGSGGVIRVNAVVFVDSTAPLAGQAGTLDHPFRTIQQAATYAAATYTGAAIIRIAPATYAGNVNVPDNTLDVLVFEGWGKEPALSSPNLPTIVGDIVVTPKSVGNPLVVSFANLQQQGNIEAANPAAQDLFVELHSVLLNGGTISANNLGVFLEHTDFNGVTSIAGTTSMSLNTDGYSWGQLVRQATTLAPAAYSREFFEEGCDYFESTLQVNGLAIGASQPVVLNHPTAREGEVGAITKTDAVPATDFQLVFSHTGAGTATYILTNLSRASTNFADDVRTVVWHMNMATAPAPP
jgi:hypothetical protein